MSRYSLLLLAALSLLAARAHAQVVVNGQIYTDGLAIVDAPQPGTTLHAGATQSVAIDISGDGHLPSTASSPDSSDSTRFDSLEVYLVSYTAKLNLTVSQGPGLLTQEPGSTVKHINWLIDTCIESGNYNLTFYEASHIDNNADFVITPLPISIQNTSPGGSCSNGTNPVQSYPQAQSAPSLSPWLNANDTPITVNVPADSNGVATWGAHPAVALAAGAVSILAAAFL